MDLEESTAKRALCGHNPGPSSVEFLQSRRVPKQAWAKVAMREGSQENGIYHKQDIFYFILFIFETGSLYVVQVGLELTM
jgi:hypothetical protein